MNITTIGLDIAKNVFQVHGVDANGKIVLRKQLKRSQVLAFFANLLACRIGLEACAGARYWARELIKFGHDARLISPQPVDTVLKVNIKEHNWVDKVYGFSRRQNTSEPVYAWQHQELTFWFCLALANADTAL